MSWRLKFAVTLCDEHGTSKDIVLWEVRCLLLFFLLADFFQSVAKQLLGNVELETEEDRSQVQDQCFQIIGSTATFKFRVRLNDDQVR